MTNDAFRIDLRLLEYLAFRLDRLADDAAAQRSTPVGSATCPAPSNLRSHDAMLRISTDLLDGVLVPTVVERFEETADILRQVGAEFANADADAAAQLASVYLCSTGDWIATEP